MFVAPKKLMYQILAWAKHGFSFVFCRDFSVFCCTAKLHLFWGAIRNEWHPKCATRFQFDFETGAEWGWFCSRLQITQMWTAPHPSWTNVNMELLPDINLSFNVLNVICIIWEFGDWVLIYFKSGCTDADFLLASMSTDTLVQVLADTGINTCDTICANTKKLTQITLQRIACDAIPVWITCNFPRCSCVCVFV